MWMVAVFLFGSVHLKNNEDAYPSAANYLKKIGWKKNSPCYYKINLDSKIPKKYLNVSAKNAVSRFFSKLFKCSFND